MIFNVNGFGISSFQFYNSAIKTNFLQFLYRSFNKFQFYNSAIKTYKSFRYTKNKLHVSILQ